MINFGIIGCGEIANRFVIGCKESQKACVLAASSRILEKAKNFANTYNIPKAYGSYLELVNDPEVEAVYIATPPFVHDEQIRLALNHGKHVLCEKPFVPTATAAQELFELAKEKGLLLMEANKTPFTPTMQSIKQMLDAKILGKVKYVEGSYCYKGSFENKPWLLSKKLAGGGMFDVGVYPLTICNYFFNEVKHYTKMEVNNQEYDELTILNVEYENGVIATMKGAIEIPGSRSLTIYGELGYLVCEHFSKGQEYTIYLYNGDTLHYTFPFTSEFTFEIEHFAACIEKGLWESPIMSASLTIQTLTMINGDSK